MLHEHHTVVIYMGLSLVSDIVDELLHRGKSASTTFTLISKATHQDERMISCALGDISSVLEVEKLESPTLLVMGPKPRAVFLTSSLQLSDALN